MKLFNLFTSKNQVNNSRSGDCSRLKQAEKEALHTISGGRSMVEMLGVLAIIGVLSVGAISGYQKAITKYKLNKQAESLNMLLNNAIQLTSSIPKDTTWTIHTSLLAKLNLIPDGMRLSDSEFILDILNNLSYFHSTVAHTWTIEYLLNNTSSSFESCKNIFFISKGYADVLLSIQRSEPTADEQHYSKGVYYGDKFCSGNRKCIRDMTLQDIEDICRVEEKNTANRYSFFLTWE